MGRYYWNRKTTVEECKKFRIGFLKENGYLKKTLQKGSLQWSWGGESLGNISLSVNENNSFVRVWYSFTNETDEAKKHRDYQIKLIKTPCNYGGHRYWFICSFCQKRVGALYLYGKNDFACRHCLNLGYKSRNESGVYKKIGVTKSYPEIDNMYSNLKRWTYKGKPTKRVKRIKKYQEKIDYAFYYMVKNKKFFSQ